MAATNRYMNFSGTGFTPTSGSLLSFTGVKKIDYDEGISIKKESADFDQFPTVGLCDFKDPSFSFDTIDAFVGFALLPGAKGVFTTTIRDAYNGVTASGGGKLYTMSNAQLESRTQGNQYRTFSTQSLKFGSVSGDGVTHPVAVTAL